MSVEKDVIAIVFDFDDTLIPDTITLLLKKYDIDTDRFWHEEVKSLYSEGYDVTLAYLKRLLEKIGHNRPLGNLTTKDLTNFGASLRSKIYSGLPGLIKDLKQYVRKDWKDIDVEFYIISGGLREIIEGCVFFKEKFTGIYASQLGSDTAGGVLKYIKRSVTFTEKTRYLFEIHKGIPAAEARTNPYLVNNYLPQNERRIPWKNFIYIGDGQTDIPAFSLINKEGGVSYGVFDPADQESAKRAVMNFLKAKRVVGTYPPEYKTKDPLGSLIRGTVSSHCSDIIVRRASVHRIG